MKWCISPVLSLSARCTKSTKMPAIAFARVGSTFPVSYVIMHRYREWADTGNLLRHIQTSSFHALLLMADLFDKGNSVVWLRRMRGGG